jgi:hypothetical protein
MLYYTHVHRKRVSLLLLESVIAEYVDEGEIPADLAFHPGEVVRPRVVGSYLDVWADDEAGNDHIMRALLQVVQTETDGPSRARMVESITRLQAVDTIREMLRRLPSGSEGLSDLGRALASLFATGSEELQQLLRIMMEMMHAQKASEQ